MGALRKSANGTLPLGSKSSPAEIALMFKGMSKTDFKMAVSYLYRRGKIIAGPKTTRLNDISRGNEGDEGEGFEEARAKVSERGNDFKTWMEFSDAMQTLKADTKTKEVMSTDENFLQKSGRVFSIAADIFERGKHLEQVKFSTLGHSLTDDTNIECEYGSRYAKDRKHFPEELDKIKRRLSSFKITNREKQTIETGMNDCGLRI